MEAIKFCSVSNRTRLLKAISNKPVSSHRLAQQLCAFEQGMQVLPCVLVAALEVKGWKLGMLGVSVYVVLDDISRVN